VKRRLKGDAIVRTLWKHSEGGITRLPALTGHKSNRLTGPVRDAYLALAHTNLSKDLNAITGFISKWNYPNDNRVLRSEWGTVNNVRFMLSSVASISPNASALGNDVYNVFVQGMESLACVEQDNFSARFLYRPPVFSDPLFQNVTIGYVFAEVPRILNDLWITNMRCTLL